MSAEIVGQRIILGLTSKNAAFRPADWAERLCGVLSCFRPEGYAGRNAHMTYSQYVKPTIFDGVKCVVVDEALRAVQPLAYHFVMNFAKDNDLQVVDACLLPDGEAKNRNVSK
ncbi:MAG: DUF3579 domain-containing protein [Pseudomonadota bacterium]